MSARSRSRISSQPLPIEGRPDPGIVTLLDFPALNFDEPFFDDTVARACREHPQATRMMRRFTDILATDETAGPAPTGMLFHSGRCGSTLICNMVAAVTGWTMLKEPDVISALLAAALAGGGQKHADRVGATVRLLTAAVAQPCLLKLSAWNVRCGPMLRALFPGTPTVFAFRDPGETVASMMAAPPSWSDLAFASRRMQARFFPSVLAIRSGSSLSPLVLFAHAWRSIVEAALTLGDDTLFVDYAALARDPVQVNDDIVAHLGGKIEAVNRAAAAQIARFYAKEKLPIAFDPARRHHRPRLSPLEAAIVDDITGDAWHRLHARTAAVTKIATLAPDDVHA